MSAGSRNGVHNPAEVLLLTRAFVILESMVGQLAPDHNYMHSFREEIERLTALHFAPERIKTKTTQLARDMERLFSDAPGDARRVLRRIAEGDLGRLPGLEALGARLSRNVTRLASAISFAALVIGGSMLLLTRAFVILESRVAQLAPDHNYMHSVREEIGRLTALHFAPERIKTRTTQLARDMERLVSDAPGDARRILRRIAEGDLGRLPGLEALGARLSRNITRLASAISFAALVIGGSMLLLTPMRGWHHILGETMIVLGVVGMLVAGIRVLRRGQVHDQH